MTTSAANRYSETGRREKPIRASLHSELVGNLNGGVERLQDLLDRDGDDEALEEAAQQADRLGSTLTELAWGLRQMAQETEYDGPSDDPDD